MSQYLGDISAYALAVSQGYTGTEEEYAELMASYATVGQTAVTAAQTATTKASEAATSATTATNKASEAATSATTATTAAEAAQADADAAALDASQALSAASTATSKASEATTAAATAVSAKDDAVSANTAAQSAKTAAQTAQTGAETAAASVQSSAAQIATNTSDISELKEDLTATNAEVTDIRVDADGKTYNSAGAAVRGQISDLKSALNLDYSYSTDVSFVLKHISPTGTLTDNSNKNAVFATPLLALKGSTIYVDAGYKFELGLYNKSTGAFVERVNWMTAPYVFNADYLVRIEISDTSESVLPDTSISSHLHYTLISQVYSPVKRTTIEFTRLSNINLNYAIGTVISLTPEDANTYRHAIVKCKTDDVFILNAKGGSNPRVWGFLDTDNKLLSVAASNTASVAQTNLMLIAPAGATKLVINDQKTGGVCVRYSAIENNDYWIDYVRAQLKNYALKSQVDEVIAQASNVFKGLGITAFEDKTLEITAPNKYNAWSFIGVVDSKLICVYSRGTSHSDNTNPAIFSKVSENGVVWSLEKEVTDTVGIRDTITGKGNNADGDFIFWNRIGQPNSGSETFKLFSTNNGNEFSAISAPTFSTRPAHIGDIIEVETVGLMAFFNTMGNGTRTWGYVKSTDDGVTWELTSVESSIADTDCPTEITAVYLGDGKIIAIGRKDVIGNTTNAMFQMQSSDYGATWTKAYTNITDIAGSTPSLVYDFTNQKLSVYYYVRGGGTLRVREASISDVWDNPTHWGSASIIANGSTSYDDSGNANATAFNDNQFVTFYSGDSADTGIYVTIT